MAFATLLLNARAVVLAFITLLFHSTQLLAEMQAFTNMLRLSSRTAFFVADLNEAASRILVASWAEQLPRLDLMSCRIKRRLHAAINCLALELFPLPNAMRTTPNKSLMWSWFILYVSS